MRQDATAGSGPDSPVIEDIIAQHAGESAFLWRLRDAAVRSPAFDLEALHRLDDRVDAHLDGLRIAGDAGQVICDTALADPDEGDVFAATVLAIDRADVRALARILGLGVRSPALARGIVSGLGWAEIAQARRFLDELVSEDAPPALRYFGIAGAAAHRVDPGGPLEAVALAGDPRLRARSLKAIGELGRADLLPLLRRELGSDDEACSFWAAWSMALLGAPEAGEALWRLALPGSPFTARAASMAVRRMDPATARARVRQLAGMPGLLRAALSAAGALGDPELLPWVIDCMAHPEHARLAGWVFATITGRELIAHKLHAPPPDDFRVGPTDDPGDPEVAPDPDDSLPWPDVAAVRAWWERHAPELPRGARLMLGSPIEPEWLRQVLRTGSQPARASAAIEMGSTLRGQPLFNVHAPAFRQIRSRT